MIVIVRGCVQTLPKVLKRLVLKSNASSQSAVSCGPAGSARRLVPCSDVSRVRFLLVSRELSPASMLPWRHPEFVAILIGVRDPERDCDCMLDVDFIIATIASQQVNVQMDVLSQHSISG